MQRGIPDFDGNYPYDRHVRFRMSVNVGDVIATGTNLHGEGINIAARLQTVCPPGAVCVSRVVRDQVGSRLGLGFKELGSIDFKNISRPIEAFLLEVAPLAEPATRMEKRRAGRHVSPRYWPGFAWSIAATCLLGGAMLSSYGWYTSRRPTPPDRPRLSIVVLPFENLSDDHERDYLADGVTDDLTTDLSRVPNMFVIARTSAYTYKGKPEDPRKIGEELGVRYLLEGSVRRLGDTVRVNAQLVATETGAHLWADRFDKQLKGLSAGQEEIVRRIGQILNVALTDIESARSKRERPTNPDAFDLILRARSIGLHPMGPREEAEKLALFEQALRLDPTSISAMTGIAYSLIESNRHGDDLERAAKYLADAAAINPNDERVLGTTGYLLWLQRRCTEAILAYQRVLEANPNSARAFNGIGACLSTLGRADEAIPMLEKAIRLDPLGAYDWSHYQFMGWAMLLLGKDEEAIVWTQRALAANPNNRPNWRTGFTLRLAAGYARLGHLDEAHFAVAEANRIWPYETVRGRAPELLSSRVYVAQYEHYQAALRLAGLRDHADENADFGVASDSKLHEEIALAGLTPTTVPGATTIRTAELERFLAERKPIVIDALAYFWGRSIPGAIGLKNAGWGGSLSDAMQDRFRGKMLELTSGDLNKPIVAVGWNSERFNGRNLALRLVALGYTQVYWYRGGREAWEVSGLPEAELTATDW